MSFKNKTFKTLNCKECSEEVRVDHNTVAVICWKCVSAQISGRPIGMPLEEWGRILTEHKKLSPDCQDSEQ